MKVLVTGANGFLGAHLCKKLSDVNLEVIALTRLGSDIEELQNHMKIQNVNADVTEFESLNKAIALIKPEVIFHLAGHVGYQRSERELMEKVNVGGTENLVKAMISNKIEKVVHISSVVAVGASYNKNEILNEDSKYNVSNLNLGYFETKRKAELYVLDKTNQGQIQSVVLNPSTIYGAADANKGSRRTQVKVAQGRFRFYPSGGVNVVSVEDVVEGIYQGFLKGKNGQRYILAGDNITIEELFSKISRFAGVPPPRYHIPTVVLKSLGRVGDILNSCGMKGAFSSENAMTATMYHWFSNEKAKRELGITFREADYSLKQSVDWMRAKKLI